MLEVDSHCPVAMTVSVDAHTRHGHESQSLSGDAARETNIEPRRAHGMRSVGARAVAGSAAQAPRRERPLRDCCGGATGCSPPLPGEGGNPFERRRTVILLS